jgi:hypothetical protein
VKPDLDTWLAQPLVHVHHRREADVSAGQLWEAARSVRLADTRGLGRLVRLRIPGLSAGSVYDDMFRAPPFNVLYTDDGALVSGLVGRIWTLRRDYPQLPDPDDFRRWSVHGTVRVMFANWVEPAGPGRAALVNETRVDAVDRGARLGLATLRPLIARAHNLIGSEGLDIAVKRAESAPPGSPDAGR